MHLGPSVRLSVSFCLFVCPHRTFVFFSATAYRIEKKNFTIDATTHVECFNDNYDVIGHVLWQPRWKNQKLLDLSISEIAPRKKLKLGTWQALLMRNRCDLFFL